MKPILLLALILSVDMLGACGKPESQHVTLSGAITIPRGRPITIMAPELLRTVGSEHALCFEPMPPDLPSVHARHRRLDVPPSGRAVVGIYAAMVAADGSIDSFPGTMYENGERRHFCAVSSGKMDLHPPYVGARVVADEIIMINGVEWRSWTPQ